METTTAAPVYVPVDEAAFAEVFAWAVRYAERRTAGLPTAATDTAIDAATAALLWAREHCTDAATWPQFARSAVKRFMSRATMKAARRASRGPDFVSLDAANACDDNDPHERFTPAGDAAVAPLLIEGLPEDLAFVCRLYFLDGFQLRDVGLLCGLTANQVMRRLRSAAELLDPDRVKRPTTADAKRFTRG